MIKKRTFNCVVVLTLLTLTLVLGSLNDTLSRAIITDNLGLAKQYIDSHRFQDVSMTEIYRLIFSYNSSSTDRKMKLENFQIGINRDYKIRVMIINLIDTSDSMLKRYSIQYNRDTEYLNVIMNEEGKNGYRKSVIEVFKEFDKYKNRIILPEGNYSYYTVNLFSTEGSVDTAANLFVIDNKGVHKVDEQTAEGGLIFMVYGEPIQKEDAPCFYIMPNQENG